MEDVIILCSKKFSLDGTNVISAIRTHLAEKNINVHVWTETLFSPGSIDSSVKIFLRNIYKYDAAIVVLTAENIIGDIAGRPTDNVIFELGACMAHFGHEKTFVMSAKNDNLKPPSYFDKFKRLEWNPTPSMDNWAAATDQACNIIIRKVKRGHFKMCDIGLPAVSAVNGYFDNFLERFLRHADIDDCKVDGCEFHDKLREASTCEIYIIISRITSNYDNGKAKSFFANRNINPAIVITDNGRPLSVHYKIDNGIMKVYDIPTTLFGCNAALEKFVNYMGVGDDDDFKKELMKKELLKFAKFLTNRIVDDPCKYKLKIVEDNLITVVTF